MSTPLARNASSFAWLGLLVLLASSSEPAWAKQTQKPMHSFAMDTAHSRVSFSVKHLFVSTISGSVPVLSAQITVPDGSVIPKRISAKLDAARLDTDDPDRNESLQGPDWFDTKRFPTWSFVGSAIKKISGNAFTVNGRLCVHGVTRPMLLRVTATSGISSVTYHATGVLNRHLFGMRVTPMDGTIGDSVQIVIDETANLSNRSR